MTYENPDVPHEVNVSRASPLAEFLRLLGGLAVAALAATLVLYFFGGWIARLIPFSSEQAWVGEAVVGMPVESRDAKREAKVDAYLQSLADDLARRMDLPQGMAIRVHYSDVEVPNAFATLGGHIVVTSGLYRRMPSENALAMVVAHEIGHVRARDPISALGGTASVAVAYAFFTGQVDGLMPYVGQIVTLGYSRRAESLADEAAIAAIRSRYGHAGGAAAVFEVLSDYSATRGMHLPSLLSTHPADATRIRRLKSAAADWNATRDPLRPLAVDDGAPAATIR